MPPPTKGSGICLPGGRHLVKVMRKGGRPLELGPCPVERPESVYLAFDLAFDDASAQFGPHDDDQITGRRAADVTNVPCGSRNVFIFYPRLARGPVDHRRVRPVGLCRPFPDPPLRSSLTLASSNHGKRAWARWLRAPRKASRGDLNSADALSVVLGTGAASGTFNDCVEAPLLPLRRFVFVGSQLSLEASVETNKKADSCG